MTSDQLIELKSNPVLRARLAKFFALEGKASVDGNLVIQEYDVFDVVEQELPLAPGAGALRETRPGSRAILDDSRTACRDCRARHPAMHNVGDRRQFTP